MLIIVAHHYVVNSGLLDCINAQTSLHFQDYFLLIFGWGGKTGINCFVLITGYFMCTSNITKKKFYRLLGEIYFYKIVIWCIFLLVGYDTFSIKNLFKEILPFSTVADNFTGCFLLFYLLIPFLNKLIQNLTEREHRWLIIWCVGVYVVLPSFVMMTVKFNYITWFCVIYFVAAYIRLYQHTWCNSKKITTILAIASVSLSWLSIIAIVIIKRRFGIDLGTGYFFVSDCNKVLAFMTGISLFLFLKNLKLKYNKTVNKIAASTFGVLLIHTNGDNMRQWLWKDFLNNIGVYNIGVYNAGYSVGHALISVTVIYIICTLIDMLRIKLLEPIFIKRLTND